MMAVQEDQLTGHEDHSFGGIAVEELITMEKQLYQFAGI